MQGSASIPGNHIALVPRHTNLSFLERDADRFEEALVHAERAYEIERATLGPDDPVAFVSTLEFGNALTLAGDPAWGFAVLEQSARILDAQDDPSLSHRFHLLRSIALTQKALGDEAASVAAYQQILDICREQRGQDWSAYADWQMAYHVLVGEMDEAMRWLEHLVEKGYRDPWLLRNPELDPMRSHPRYSKLVAPIYEAIAWKQELGGARAPASPRRLEWRMFFESGDPELRGPVVPQEWFDEVRRSR